MKAPVSSVLFCLFLSLSLSQVCSANPAQNASDHPGQIQNDSAIVSAVQARREVFYVEGANLVVTKILPDDTNGLPHQKWEAKLSDGSIIQVVYNSDMGARVPIHVGDDFAVGGQFLWVGHSGLIHWVHDDPQHRRPDGYVYLNGVVYGDSDHEDQNQH